MKKTVHYTLLIVGYTAQAIGLYLLWKFNPILGKAALFLYLGRFCFKSIDDN